KLNIPAHVMFSHSSSSSSPSFLPTLFFHAVHTHIHCLSTVFSQSASMSLAVMTPPAVSPVALFLFLSSLPSLLLHPLLWAEQVGGFQIPVNREAEPMFDDVGEKKEKEEEEDVNDDDLNEAEPGISEQFSQQHPATSSSASSSDSVISHFHPGVSSELISAMFSSSTSFYLFKKSSIPMGTSLFIIITPSLSSYGSAQTCGIPLPPSPFSSGVVTSPYPGVLCVSMDVIEIIVKNSKRTWVEKDRLIKEHSDPLMSVGLGKVRTATGSTVGDASSTISASAPSQPTKVSSISPTEHHLVELAHELRHVSDLTEYLSATSSAIRENSLEFTLIRAQMCECMVNMAVLDGLSEWVREEGEWSRKERGKRVGRLKSTGSSVPLISSQEWDMFSYIHPCELTPLSTIPNPFSAHNKKQGRSLSPIFHHPLLCSLSSLLSSSLFVLPFLRSTLSLLFVSHLCGDNVLTVCVERMAEAESACVREKGFGIWGADTTAAERIHGMKGTAKGMLFRWRWGLDGSISASTKKEYTELAQKVASTADDKAGDSIDSKQTISSYDKMFESLPHSLFSSTVHPLAMPSPSSLSPSALSQPPKWWEKGQSVYSMRCEIRTSLMSLFIARHSESGESFIGCVKEIFTELCKSKRSGGAQKYVEDFNVGSVSLSAGGMGEDMWSILSECICHDRDEVRQCLHFLLHKISTPKMGSDIKSESNTFCSGGRHGRPTTSREKNDKKLHVTVESKVFGCGEDGLMPCGVGVRIESWLNHTVTERRMENWQVKGMLKDSKDAKKKEALKKNPRAKTPKPKPMERRSSSSTSSSVSVPSHATPVSALLFLTPFSMKPFYAISPFQSVDRQRIVKGDRGNRSIVSTSVPDFLTKTTSSTQLLKVSSMIPLDPKYPSSSLKDDLQCKETKNKERVIGIMHIIREKKGEILTDAFDGDDEMRRRVKEESLAKCGRLRESVSFVGEVGFIDWDISPVGPTRVCMFVSIPLLTKSFSDMSNLDLMFVHCDIMRKLPFVRISTNNLVECAVRSIAEGLSYHLVVDGIECLRKAITFLANPAKRLQEDTTEPLYSVLGMKRDEALQYERDVLMSIAGKIEVPLASRVEATYALFSTIHSGEHLKSCGAYNFAMSCVKNVILFPNQPLYRAKVLFAGHVMDALACVRFGRMEVGGCGSLGKTERDQWVSKTKPQKDDSLFTPSSSPSSYTMPSRYLSNYYTPPLVIDLMISLTREIFSSMPSTSEESILLLSRALVALGRVRTDRSEFLVVILKICTAVLARCSIFPSSPSSLICATIQCLSSTLIGIGMHELEDATFCDIVRQFIGMKKKHKKEEGEKEEEEDKHVSVDCPHPLSRSNLSDTNDVYTVSLGLLCSLAHSRHTTAVRSCALKCLTTMTRALGHIEGMRYGICGIQGLSSLSGSCELTGKSLEKAVNEWKNYIEHWKEISSKEEEKEKKQKDEEEEDFSMASSVPFSMERQKRTFTTKHHCSLMYFMLGMRRIALNSLQYASSIGDIFDCVGGSLPISAQEYITDVYADFSIIERVFPDSLPLCSVEISHSQRTLTIFKSLIGVYQKAIVIPSIVLSHALLTIMNNFAVPHSLVRSACVSSSLLLTPLGNVQMSVTLPILLEVCMVGYQPLFPHAPQSFAGPSHASCVKDFFYSNPSLYLERGLMSVTLPILLEVCMVGYQPLFPHAPQSFAGPSHASCVKDFFYSNPSLYLERGLVDGNGRRKGEEQEREEREEKEEEKDVLMKVIDREKKIHTNDSAEMFSLPSSECMLSPSSVMSTTSLRPSSTILFDSICTACNCGGMCGCVGKELRERAKEKRRNSVRPSSRVPVKEQRSEEGKSMKSTESMGLESQRSLEHEEKKNVFVLDNDRKQKLSTYSLPNMLPLKDIPNSPHGLFLEFLIRNVSHSMDDFGHVCISSRQALREMVSCYFSFVFDRGSMPCWEGCVGEVISLLCRLFPSSAILSPSPSSSS
ncbi:hypothetical protein ADUPG1_011050, partial [Aduncisulcus paluster]